MPPRARVILLDGSTEAYKSYVNSHNEEGTVALCYTDDTKDFPFPPGTGERARSRGAGGRLFDTLREADPHE